MKFMIHIVLEIILLCSLFVNTFFYEMYDTSFTLIALVIFLGINLLIERRRIPKARNVGDAIFVVAGLGIFFIGALYFAGMFNGFTVNFNSLFKNYVDTMVWVKVFLVVGLTEAVRYFCIPRDEKYNKYNWIRYVLLVGICVMTDIVISTKVYNLAKFNQLYEFIALIVVQSISKNIFLMYSTKKYGIYPSLVYRFILDLYIYIIPITPKFNVFIEGVIRLVFPYFVYLTVQSVTERKAATPVKKQKKEGKLSNIIGTIFFAILVALVSREFEYCMIAIGSGSMTGTINKGDAVIYRAYDKSSEVPEEGDVLVFYKDSMIVVHRIIKKHNVYGKVVYQTKGDANEEADNWLVHEEDVIGVVKRRVPLIAWPSVKLNELF